MSLPSQRTRPRRAAVAFVLVTVALDILALGVIIPVLPNLVLSMVDGRTDQAASAVGLFSTAWAAAQLLAGPLLGMLSDRFGRRPILLLGNAALGLNYVLMALAPTLGWLLAARVIAGMAGATIPTATAYIADVTAPERRARAFGGIGAAFGIGFVLGPAIGGMLGGIDLRAPFWLSAVLCLANALWGLFVLPESLPAERRAPLRWSRANPVGSLRMLRERRGLGALATVAFLGYLAHEVYPAVFVLYAGHRYGWDETTVGLVLAAVGVLGAIVQGGLVGPIVARLGERRTLLTGLVAGAIGFAIYGSASTGTVFLVGLPVMALWGLSGVSAQSLMSRRVGIAEQGQLQGMLHGLRGLTGLLGPGLFSQSFRLGIAPGTPLALPGLPFLLASSLLLTALVVATVARTTVAEPAR
ncbi:MAG: MFS transporter [Myxococcales bacterium]|nr:MFS transporter [Myxococcales bacterium]